MFHGSGLAFIALLTAAGAGQARALQSPIAITGVTVVDPVGGKSTNQTVIITGGTVTAVGLTGRTPIPAGAVRVDGKGKFLIPGLWDMHVHLGMIGREAVPVFLAAGVTGVRDMGGDPAVILPLRDSIAAGLVLGPRVKATGNIIESARWLNNVIKRTEPLGQPELLAELRRRFGIETAEDGIKAIDSLSRMGIDHAKIRNYPGPAAYSALARAARERGIKLVGHAPLPSMIELISDSGFASIEHGTVGVKNGKLVDGFSELSDSARRALFRRFARNGTAWDPTLVSSKVRFIPDSTVTRMIDDSLGITDPELRLVPPTLRQSWRASRALASVSTQDDWSALYRANLRDVREMTDAGVLVLAGTDVAVPTLIPGYSLHNELVALVEEGQLTPAEALRSATVNPARVMGLGETGGRVVAGAPADLVLLDADPLVDIRVTRRSHVVIAAGRYLDREALRRLAGR
jgi:imidazolonepropionase-like amidohydrolase